MSRIILDSRVASPARARAGAAQADDRCARAGGSSTCCRRRVVNGTWRRESREWSPPHRRGLKSPRRCNVGRRVDDWPGAGRDRRIFCGANREVPECPLLDRDLRAAFPPEIVALACGLQGSLIDPPFATVLRRRHGPAAEPTLGGVALRDAGGSTAALAKKRRFRTLVEVDDGTGTWEVEPAERRPASFRPNSSAPYLRESPRRPASAPNAVLVCGAAGGFAQIGG
jgi:hypothetical protein